MPGSVSEKSVTRRLNASTAVMAAQTSQLNLRNRQAASTSVDNAGRGDDMPAFVADER
jgi:hypothetical protein